MLILVEESSDEGMAHTGCTFSSSLAVSMSQDALQRFSCRRRSHRDPGDGWSLPVRGKQSSGESDDTSTGRGRRDLDVPAASAHLKFQPFSSTSLHGHERGE